MAFFSLAVNVMWPLMEPDADTPHTMSFVIKDTCTGGAENYSVSSLKIDVLGQS